MLSQFSKMVLQASGFQWEILRYGESQLGYWKKSLDHQTTTNSYPKRFVLLPGFGDTPLSWWITLLKLESFLKKHFEEILIFDFPGFSGFLSKEKSFESIDHMILVISDVLDTLKPHTILGHSLGGWLAAIYATDCGNATRPRSPCPYQGPKSIILISPSGVFSNDTVWEDWQKLFRSVMDSGFQQIRSHFFFKEPLWFPVVTPYFRTMFHREDILNFMKSFREDHRIDANIHKIQSNVFLVWGKQDAIIPVSCASSWMEKLDPKLHHPERMLILENIGHNPQIEAPFVTSAILKQVLANAENISVS
jgi:pimeloyl-ACP methyl ester carboxylesterase